MVDRIADSLKAGRQCFIYKCVVIQLKCMAWNGLASYPGSNYAGEGKRAWYLPFAVALDFTGISVNSILSVFFRKR